jgi:hypothetical protein
MGFFTKLFGNKNKIENSSDIEFVQKNYVDIINYWSGIIEGTKKLKDGSIFNDFTVFNTKHLEYSKHQIQLALINRGINSKDEKDFEGTQVCYMYTANFSDSVKDKYVSSTQKITDLVMKYGEKDTDKLMNEMAKLPDDEKESKEFFKAITNDQMRYVKFFKEMVKKSKK